MIQCIHHLATKHLLGKLLLNNCIVIAQTQHIRIRNGILFGQIIVQHHVDVVLLNRLRQWQIRFPEFLLKLLPIVSHMIPVTDSAEREQLKLFYYFEFRLRLGALVRFIRFIHQNCSQE